MRIRVLFDNDILGHGVLWEGDSKDILQIRNYVARDLAHRVVKDGVRRKNGMWTVFEVKIEETEKNDNNK